MEISRSMPTFFMETFLRNKERLFSRAFEKEKYSAWLPPMSLHEDLISLSLISSYSSTHQRILTLTFIEVEELEELDTREFASLLLPNGKTILLEKLSKWPR